MQVMNPPDAAGIEWVDVLNGNVYGDRVHEHGFLKLVDCMPRLVPADRGGDFAVVRAARLSFGGSGKSSDRDLIRYMLRHNHGTPFESVEFQFHWRLPIFVARQLVRHRTATINEVSARYTALPDMFYVPDAEDVCLQSKSNKQGRGGVLEREGAEQFRNSLQMTCADAYELYQHDLEDRGVARELARARLPIAIYTDMYWKCDLRNVFNFLKLRLDAHAQAEIREYAHVMLELVRLVAPLSCEAFEDYVLNSVTLSALEVEAVQSGTEALMGTENKREQEEWAAKRSRLAWGSVEKGS